MRIGNVLPVDDEDIHAEESKDWGLALHSAGL
jgi:hypothetical protein